MSLAPIATLDGPSNSPSALPVVPQLKQKVAVEVEDGDPVGVLVGYVDSPWLSSAIPQTWTNWPSPSPAAPNVP